MFVNSDIESKQRLTTLIISNDEDNYRYNVVVSAIGLVVVILLVNGLFFYWCWYWPREQKRRIDVYYTGSAHNDQLTSSDGIFADDETDENEQDDNETGEDDTEFTETDTEPEPEPAPVSDAETTLFE